MADKKNSMMIKVGVWAFTIGVIIALLAGFLSDSMGGLVTGILVVLGIIVGFLNVSKNETSQFLMSSVAIMIALFTAGAALNNMTTLGVVGEYMLSLLANINIFVFPATIVVAIKSIYALAKD